MKAICIVPVSLYGKYAGEYARGEKGLPAELAEQHPNYFQIIPDSGTKGKDAGARKEIKQPRKGRK